MIQDIYPYVLDNHYYQDRKAHVGDKVFSFQNDQILLKKDGRFFQIEDCPKESQFTYLFAIGTHHFYLSDLSAISHDTLSVYKLRFYQPQFLGFAALTAFHLYNWYKQHKFCGQCGHLLEPSLKERALCCKNCQNTIYPTISPAMIVAIINDKGQLLVTKYASGPYQKYALVAGYAEIGETIEETVIREAKEETGLQLKNICYYSCQPWGISSSLLFGFFAEVDGNNKIHMDRQELRLAKWVNASDEIDTSGFSSLTGNMVQLFKSGQYKKYLKKFKLNK